MRNQVPGHAGGGRGEGPAVGKPTAAPWSPRLQAGDSHASCRGPPLVPELSYVCLRWTKSCIYFFLSSLLSSRGVRSHSDKISF